MQFMSIPLFAGFVFGILGTLMAWPIGYVARIFAEEAGVSPVIFAAVPGLFSMLFAVIVYQNAEKRIQTISQSLSRGILIALLTCIALSFLATFVWSSSDFFGSFSWILKAVVLIAGGPLLGAGLLAAALVGWLIKKRRLSWILVE
jgi:hypothetical protein